jgi:hypothetical protein
MNFRGLACAFSGQARSCEENSPLKINILTSIFGDCLRLGKKIAFPEHFTFSHQTYGDFAPTPSKSVVATSWVSCSSIQF